MLTIAKRLVEKILLKQQWANFIVAWSSSIIIEVGDRCHCNFKADMQANLGSTTPTKKKKTQQWAKVWMQARKEVATSLQQLQTHNWN